MEARGLINLVKKMTNPIKHNDQRQWHLSKSIPITVLIAFLTQTLSFIWYASKLDSRVETNHKTMVEHIKNKSEHMPFEDKIRFFVPRVELDSRLLSIERTVKETKDQQAEISKDIKEILRKAR